MANPLARVAMTNLVDMEKKGERKSSRKNNYNFKSARKSSFSSGRSDNARSFLGGRNYSSQSNNSSDINLSPSQENLLLEIIGGEKSSGGRNSMANGYKSSSNSSVKGLSLEELAGDKMGGTSPSSVSNTSYSSKSSYGQKSNNYGKRSNMRTGSGMKAVSVEELAGGKTESSSGSTYKAPANRARQQGTVHGGMISLEELGEEVGVNKEESKPQSSSKSSVRSSVIGNLEGYVPKVSLDSIGKSSKF